MKILFKMNLALLFLTNVIARRRALLTFSVSSVKLQFSEDGLQQALFRAMHSCCIDFIQVVANSENHLDWILNGQLNPNSHVKKGG